MTIRVSCPSCEAIANIEEQSLGRRGRCKRCGHVFALARPDGEPASVMSGDASAWKGSSPARPTARPTNLPEQFGRYRIMKQLGQGGMGAVYLAHDTKLNRPVALKVPYFSPSDGPQAVQRFEREARAAATLDHPNLCQVFDVGEINGIHYLIMPYIEGKPLSEAMTRDKSVTEAQAAAVVRKLALALHEAHEKGIIHRDLKPGNIMVNRRRELIIMDFGLARVMDGDDKPITRTGHVLGTALYMAPEQAAGDINAIGPSADVYSLGVMLYELLAGVRPFEGPWSVVIGLKSVMDPDPPLKHRPDLSPDLNAICLKAIAKDPKHRYPTMAEFAEALNAFLTVAPGPAPILTPSGTAHPTEGPESLAAQIFAGIITREVTSLRGKSPIARSEPEPVQDTPLSVNSPRRSRWAWPAVSAASLLCVLLIAWLAGIIKVKTPDGVIVLENLPKDAKGGGSTGPETLPKAAPVAAARENAPGISSTAIPPANREKAKDAPLLTRRVVDFLKHIDLKRDRVRGVWKSEAEGALVVTSGPAERLRLPYVPPAEYDYLIEFTLLDGDGDLWQACAAIGTTFSWHMGNENHSACGFNSVNGKGSTHRANPTKTTMADFPKKGQRYRSVVKVRRNNISAWIDGQKVTEHWTDFKDLGIFSQDGVGANSLGVGAGGARVQFHRIEVEEITGQGKICGELATPGIPVPIAAGAPRRSLVSITHMAQEGRPTINTVPQGMSVIVDGKACDQFIYAFAPTSIIYPIPEKAVAFGVMGVRPFDAQGQEVTGAWRFKIYIDGDLAHTSDSTLKTEKISIEIPIPRLGHRIELRTESFSGNAGCFAVWAYPEFVLSDR